MQGIKFKLSNLELGGVGGGGDSRPTCINGGDHKLLVKRFFVTPATHTLVMHKLLS